MSKVVAGYESFLLKNVSTISSLESSLRSISWFLPGRFRDGELASESLSALTNVVAMYHDTLLDKLSDRDDYKPLIPLSLHTRFTKAWTNKHERYKWVSRTLELIRFTELVIEMGLRRRVSSKTKWRTIVTLEFVKAILRFFILRITRRPLVSPLVPVREFDPSAIPSTNSATSSPTLVASSPPYSRTTTPDHFKNNKVPMPPHPLLAPPPPLHSEMTVEEYLLPKALTTASVKSSSALIRRLSSPQDWLSEGTYILRPLVYAFLLSRDRKSNRPLMIVLFMELFSRYLRRTPARSESLERSEYARRDRDIFWYLLRGSIWETFTRPKIESCIKALSTKPLLNLLGALAGDWLPLIDDYYYYTAP